MGFTEKKSLGSSNNFYFYCQYMKLKHQPDLRDKRKTQFDPMILGPKSCMNNFLDRDNETPNKMM